MVEQNSSRGILSNGLQTLFSMFTRHLILLRCVCVLFVLLGFPSCTHSQYPPDEREESRLTPHARITSYQLDKAVLQSIYRRLEYGGYRPGPYNPSDQTQLNLAIKAFQEFMGLELTGKFDQNTWDAIRNFLKDPEDVELPEQAPTPFTASAASIPTPVKRQRVPPQWPPRSGIALVQGYLKDLGYSDVILTDRIDLPTKQAIQHFQSINSMASTGQLNRETIFALLNEHCQSKGGTCRLSFSLNSPPDDRSMVRIQLHASDGKTIFIQAMQHLLLKLNYPFRKPDGINDREFQDVIRQFQKDLEFKELTGQLDIQTISSLFSEGCHDGCTFDMTMSMQPVGSSASSGTTSTSGTTYHWVDKDGTEHYSNIPPGVEKTPTPGSSTPPKVTYTKIEPTLADLLHSHPVKVGEKAYAIEKFECSDISGDWVIFYEGTVKNKDDNTANLQLEKRYGYRYYPKEDGIDSTDWWCIPKKKHCYSPIEFSDWGGKYFPYQTTRFPTKDVYSAEIGIVNGMSLFLQEQCK